MSNAIVTLMTTAVVLTAVLALTQSAFKSASMLSESWVQMEERSATISRTEIQVVEVVTDTPPWVDITIENSGQVSIRDFEAWDVIVQYYATDTAFHQLWLSPSTDAAPPPGDNQWAVVGLYLDASASIPEAFQPNILDPAEEMIIRIKLAPGADGNSNNQAVISTPNGISVSTPF